jgi:hypothetical protein
MPASRQSAAVQMSAQAFGELFADLRTWGQWGADDVRGALNYIGPDQVRQAARLVDALCHVTFLGSLYNGIPAGSVTAAGASRLGAEHLRDGVVGRGAGTERARRLIRLRCSENGCACVNCRARLKPQPSHLEGKAAWL